MCQPRNQVRTRPPRARRTHAPGRPRRGFQAPPAGADRRARVRRRGPRPTRRVSLLAGAVATALAAGCVLSGCGTVPFANATDSANCATPGFSGSEIRLGFVYPDSGPLASSLSAARAGFQARIGEANAAGGIHGRKIVYDWRDDQGTAPGNLQAVRDLDAGGVFGLVEATTAASGGADFLLQKNIPVTGIPTELQWSDRRYRNLFAFAYLFAPGPSATTFGDYAKAEGGTTAAVIQTDAAADATIGAMISGSLAARGIPTVPGPFVYSPATTSVEQLAQKVKASGADVVVTTLAGRNLAEVARALREAGVPIRVMLSPSGYDSSLLGEYGQDLTGVTSAITYLPFELGGPAHLAYLHAMSAYAPELQRPGQEVALVTYILTDLFLFGLDRAGTCPTRASYVDTLRASTYTSGLLPGPVNLTSDFGRAARCFTFMRVNETGTGAQAVAKPGADGAGRFRWCGDRLEG